MDQGFASLQSDVAALKLDFEAQKADLATLQADMDTVKADMDTVRADIATLTTVTDVLALKVASIESTTADTNRRVRVRGFDD